MAGIYDDNFDDQGPTGSAPTNWENNNYPILQVSNATYHSSPYSLWAYGSYGIGPAEKYCRTKSTAMNPFTDALVDFWMRIKFGGSNAIMGRLYFSDGSWSTGRDNYASYIQWNYYLNKLYAQDSTGSGVEIGSFTTDTWFRVRLKHDMTAGTYSIWLNDTEVLTDEGLYGNLRSISGLLVYAVTGSSSYVETFFDDFKIGPAILSSDAEVNDTPVAEINEVSLANIAEINGMVVTDI